jgi:hypothetical protein
MSCSVSWNDFEENISEFCIRVLFFVFNWRHHYLYQAVLIRRLFFFCCLFCSIFISVEYGLPTVCIQMAQEVLAHLLVINTSVCTICLTNQRWLYTVSPCNLSNKHFWFLALQSFLFTEMISNNLPLWSMTRKLVFSVLQSPWLSLELCMRVLLYYTHGLTSS